MTYPANLRLLAIDAATVTGFALLLNGELTSGSQSFRRTKLEHPGATLARFQTWFAQMLATHKPDAVIFEDSAGFFKSQSAVEVCVGLRGLLLAATARSGTPVHRYAATSVKLAFAGSGKADKAAIARECRRRWPGFNPVDENESDARAILCTHLVKSGFEELQLLAP